MRLLRFIPLFALLAVVAVVLAGCGGGSTKAVPSDSVAVVGSANITKSEFTLLMDGTKSAYVARKTPFPKPGTSQYKALQDQTMKYLVQQSELEQKAKSLGITVTDKDVQARIAQIKKQYFAGNDAKYKQQLKAQGLTEPLLALNLHGQILSEKLYAKVTGAVKVTDADIKAYYDAHKSTYSKAASRDVRHILVNNKKLADSIETQLKGGADFAKLAKKYSKDPGSAAQGGKLTITKGQTVAPFDKVAFSLKKNELSAPVHTTYGWHIIQALSDTKPATQQPLKDVKASISTQLLQTKKTDAINKWVDDVNKEYAKKIAYRTGYTPLATTAVTTAPATTTG
ncbi:MAG: PpiC-type peptidyl-prolyl cis-trans isomerase [Actinomycetia bacterium]|jgi:foldase protein PrsA|nr:PpiC-type peptidyl-prolyl cis-trans isomerase [Actinomycetes bacterium]